MQKIIRLIGLTFILASCSNPQEVPLINLDFASMVDVEKFIPVQPTSRPKATIAVYELPDRTGARRSNGNFSELSTAVTQNAESLLIEALHSVGAGTWFTVVERQNLSHLQEERRITASQRLEQLQRAHSTAEDAPYNQELTEIESNIQEMQLQIEREYQRIQNSGINTSEIPSPTETDENLEKYRQNQIAQVIPPQQFNAFDYASPIGSLAEADYIISGAIVSYEPNINSSGTGVRIFNTAYSKEVLTDTVTVNLRLVRVSDGVIMSSHTVTKRVISTLESANSMNYVMLNAILEIEAGQAVTEPITLALYAAILDALKGIISDTFN